MRQEARARDLDIDVQAGSVDNLPMRLVGIDTLLVGPHLRNMFDELRETATQAQVVAELLPPLTFDSAGASAALDIAVASTRLSNSSHLATPVTTDHDPGRHLG